jgi:hypothetical protein
MTGFSTPGSYNLEDRLDLNVATAPIGIAKYIPILGWLPKYQAGWLTINTYLMVLVVLFIVGSIRETRFIFPVWVLLTSLYVLITNMRLVRREETT